MRGGVVNMQRTTRKRTLPFPCGATKAAMTSIPSSGGSGSRTWNPAYGIQFRPHGSSQSKGYSSRYPLAKPIDDATGQSYIWHDASSQFAADSRMADTSWDVDDVDVASDSEISSAIAQAGDDLSSLSVTERDGYALSKGLGDKTRTAPTWGTVTANKECRAVKEPQFREGHSQTDSQCQTLEVSWAPKYKMSEKKLRQAMKAASGSPESFWSYSFYEDENGNHPKARYCHSYESISKIAAEFLDEEVVGFDIEWAAQAKSSDPWWQNVALIQIASQEQIGLFQVARSGKGLPSEEVIPGTLKALLEDDRVVKVGVNIGADSTRLLDHLQIRMQGAIELSHLHRLVKYSQGETRDLKMINKKTVALAVQVLEHLQLPLLKSAVRTSDWSANLDKAQLCYAADDAYAGLHLYHALDGKRKALDPIPPRPAFQELKLPIRLADGQTVAEVEANELAAKVMDDSNANAEDDLGVSMSVAASISDATGQDKAIRVKKDNNLIVATCVELEAADLFLQQWYKETPNDHIGRAKVRPSGLRAYYLWHHQEADVPDICKTMRTPPLKESTVASYIRNAIKDGNLPHNKFRKQELYNLIKPYHNAAAARRPETQTL